MKTAGPRASLALLVVGCLLAATATTTTAFATMMHQSDGVNVYDEFVKLFNSRAITLESVQLIRQNLLARLTYCSTSPHVCDDCLPTETLFDIAANVSDIDAGLDESQFHRVSVVMFYAALYPERVCRAPSLDYLDYRVGMLSAHREPTQQADTFSVQQLREILRQINATYTATRSHGCFGEQNIFEQLHLSEAQGAHGEELERIASLVLFNLVQGSCIRHSVDAHFFVYDVLERYGENNTLSLEELELLMEDLGIGNYHGEAGAHDDHADHGDHDDSKDHDGHDDHADHSDHDDSKHHDGHDEDDHGAHDDGAHDDGNNKVGDHDGGDHDDGADHSDHLRRRQKRSQKHGVVVADAHDHGTVLEHAQASAEATKAHETEDENAGNHDNAGYLQQGFLRADGDKSDTCFTAEQLWEVFDYPSSYRLSETDFIEACPALLQQIVSKSCEKKTETESNQYTPTKLEAYGYGALAILVISLLSLIGAITIPFISTVSYHYIMMGFIALAIGTMAGDALLHLIPHSLGGHEHKETAHGHEDENVDGSTALNIVIEPMILKLLAVLGAIYGFFVFETLMELAKDSVQGPEKDADHAPGGGGGHGHSHVPDHEALTRGSPFRKSTGHSHVPDPVILKQYTRRQSSNIQSSVSRQNLTSSLDLSRGGSTTTLDSALSTVLPYGATNGVAHDANANTSKLKTSNTRERARSFCSSFNTVALMILMGDIMHNVSDGLAIGAAFAGSTEGGMSTSIAVLCHELPHELGDFALFLSLGLTVKQALGLNLLAALTGFAGFFVGVSVGADADVRQWIFAATAGMFLYISLVEMMPELKNYKADSTALSVIVQNVGMLTGMGAMLVIAVFEEHIRIGGPK